MKSIALRTVLLLWLGCGLSPSAFGVSTNTYWVGAGDVSNWHDPANWTNGWVPNNRGWSANISNNVALTFTNTGALDVNQIIATGSGKLTFGFSTVGLSAGWTDYLPGAKLYVGPGDIDFGNAALTFNYGNNVLELHGDAELWALSTGHDNVYTITQGAGTGYFRVRNFAWCSNVGGPIKAWRFGTNTLTIAPHPHGTGHSQFQGQPTFEAGAPRPNWTVTSGINSPGGPVRLDLNGYTLWGNTLSLANGAAAYRHTCLSNGVAGGTVDVNTLIIGNGQELSYVSLSNTAVILRGGGTNYDNRSTNCTRFVMTNNCTATFAPTGGTCNLDSGSKDRNSVLLNPVDWENNFAFDVIRIDSNSTVTLTGTANIEGGGTNAVYGTSIEGLGSGATLVLNGHNVYLKKRATNVTVDRTGGGRVYQAQAGTVVLIR